MEDEAIWLMQGHYCSMPVCESSILPCKALCFNSHWKDNGN